MSEAIVGASGGHSVDMPGYRLLFPPGWAEYGVDEGAERDLLVRTRAKIKPLGRPDLDFSLTSSIKSAFRQLRSREAIALYLPSELAGDAILPMSITASRLVDPLGGPLDARITEIFRDYGGEFLGDDRSIVRWRRLHRSLEGLPGLSDEQVNYAIPVPGTGRRMALLLSTSIIQDPAGSISQDSIDLMVALSDSIIGTFTWASAMRPRD